jgi:hypothetical protein
MSTLSTGDKGKVVSGLMKYWSSLWEEVDLSFQDLWAAVNATDTWIDTNQTDYNTSLPQAARDNLTQAQKTMIFCAVSLARVSISFLRRVFGGAI